MRRPVGSMIAWAAFAHRMAPEVLDGQHGRSKYGQASDVYSFACVLYEYVQYLPPIPVV